MLPWVLALVLIRPHQHLDTGTLVAVVFGLASVSIGMPTLYVTWAAYRGPKQSDSLSLAEVADRLATAMGAQWSAEDAVRRLNDPWPLPVSWAAADPSLTDAWGSLVKLRATGAGWPEPAPAQTWAGGPDGLAGEGADLVTVLARVPTGRLVVLGEPGAGKTMLMVRLMLGLLDRRADGAPVPFLASMASWNPAVQDLRDWLAARLLTDYPALADSPSADRTEPTQAAALLASGLILPVLDGLDEIPEQVRGAAIGRINDALRPGEQVVVTCRTEQYRDAVRPQEGVEVTLRAAAAVQLNPLDADAVRGYLRDAAPGPAALARWDPVLALLGTTTPAGQALTTPLMVGLAQAIYNPLPDELAGTLRDPAELCSPALADQAAVESLLFDAFIPAAYRHDRKSRWKPQDAERWLVFLARHLDRTIASPDLAWWQLPQAARSIIWAAGAMVGVVVGVVYGDVFRVGAIQPRLTTITHLYLVAMVANVIGLVFGIVIAGVSIAAVVRREPVPVRGFRWPPLRAVFNLVPLLVLMVGFGIWFGATKKDGISWAGTGVGGGLVLGAWLEIVYVVGSWLVKAGPAPLDIDSAASPPATLVADRRTGTVVGVLAGVVAGALGGAGEAFVIKAGIGAGIRDVLGIGAGVATAMAAWLIFSSAVAAWPSYAIARIWLALRHRLPWQLMAFLADAHRRGVLRQAGAVYQFRHIELQHRLAARP